VVDDAQGPCEIWLDDEMVLHDDDCYSTYGGEDQDVKSVFPVDYSVCQTKGCKEMRFYWLAFQGLNSKTVWQVYSKWCFRLVVLLIAVAYSLVPRSLQRIASRSRAAA
jgi:hypothetical protein